MTDSAKTLELDVAIIGGGLAGNLVARQLVRAHPKLRIGMFEKARERSFKVGESTVELASNYLIRRLCLSRYLYENQLPKNGLRFFFDTPERDADLEQMSEIGSVALPFIPSFQIDRAKMEADLLELNREAGVRVHCPSKVARLEMGQDGRPHRFEAKSDDETQKVSARWLVDASGRASMVARTKDLRVQKDHAMAAVWGRFTGVRDLDDFGSEAFRSRIKNTSRVLSTNHLCYPGYWIWFIPLGGGITSVGVVIEKEKWREEMRSAEGFISFLHEHRAAAQLMEDAELIDIMSYGQLAYGTKRYFHGSERWGLIGEAAAFPDPLYSPGSDFIALENDFVCDLIARDMAGESSDALAERADLFDGFMQHRFDSTMLLYENLYGSLASYELFGMKWDFDIACYYNLWLEPYMRDQHLDAKWLKNQVRVRPLVAKLMENFAELFREVEEHLEREGNLYRSNLGAFTGYFPTMEGQVELGSSESAKGAIRRSADAFNLVRRRALELLGEPEKAKAAEALSMRHFMAGKPVLPELAAE